MRTVHSGSRVALVALALLGASACRRRKRDEELLREKIDCTPVHLYVASKIAILRTGSDPSVQNARAQLMAAISAAERIAHGLERGGTQGALAAASDGGAPVAAPHVELADVGRLGLALLSLRAEGARVVRSGREDELQPILPRLLTGGQEVPSWVVGLDVNTEHAVFFLVLLALKFSERVPVPIPPEIVLYEGSRIDVERVSFVGTRSALNAGRAYVFAANELCDLASREASAIDRRPLDLGAMRSSYGTFSGGRSLSDAQARSLDGTFRAVGHGASAVCYGQRGDDAQMKAELQRFIDSLHALGVPREETGVLRAFLAFESNDVPGARAALAEARRMRDLDDGTRREIDAIERALAGGDRGLIRRQFDRGKLSLLTARVVYRQLERTGLFEAIADKPEIRRVRAFLSGSSSAVDAGRRAVGSTANDAQQRARGWFDRLRR